MAYGKDVYLHRSPIEGVNPFLTNLTPESMTLPSPYDPSLTRMETGKDYSNIVPTPQESPVDIKRREYLMNGIATGQVTKEQAEMMFLGKTGRELFPSTKTKVPTDPKTPKTNSFVGIGKDGEAVTFNPATGQLESGGMLYTGEIHSKITPQDKPDYTPKEVIERYNSAADKILKLELEKPKLKDYSDTKDDEERKNEYEDGMALYDRTLEAYAEEIRQIIPYLKPTDKERAIRFLRRSYGGVDTKKQPQALPPQQVEANPSNWERYN